ncbi:MAG: thrombospondin type 3 repeat-containing protein [Nevskiales bacterium]
MLGTFDDGSQDVTIADRATWTSSNPNAVRVSNRDLTLTTGETLRKGALVVTGNTGDTATITAQFVGLSASQDVIVRAGTVEVSPTQVTIASGTLIQMFATAVLGGGATDTPGTNRVVGFNDGVIWESTNPAVATVDSGTGVVTAVAAGPVTIRARAGVVCPSASDAETVVTVNNPALQSITLQPTTLFSLSDIGRNTLALVRLIGNYAGNFAQDLAGQATLESSTPATISVSGTLIQALAASGTTTLSTRDQNGTLVTTVPAGPDNAAINGNKRLNAGGLDVRPVAPNTGTMLAGTSMDLDAIGNYVDAGGADQPDQNLYRDVTWTSLDTSIASVSTGFGRVFAVAAGGPVNIRADRVDPVLAQTVTDMTAITVLPFAAASLVPPLTVSCPEPVLIGNAADCTATVSFAAGGTQDVSLFAIWSSDNPAAADVSNAQLTLLRENELGRPIAASTLSSMSTRTPLPGRVFGAGAGQAVITATLFDASGVQLATGSDTIDNNLQPPPPDADGDGVTDAQDQCANTPAGATVNNVGCPDSDGDGDFDNADNCPLAANADQLNTDGVNDGGDACDTDDDNDGDLDGADNCPLVANADQLNTDGANDGGDACDTDDDNDGVADAGDQCPTVPPGAVPAGPTRPGCPCTTPAGGICLVP